VSDGHPFHQRISIGTYPHARHVPPCMPVSMSPELIPPEPRFCEDSRGHAYGASLLVTTGPFPL
jgi:hypothetical protein